MKHDQQIGHRSRRMKCVAALALILASALPVAARDAVRFNSPEAAFEHGRGAYRSGDYAYAVQALTFAANRGSLLGKHLLATLYADSNSTFVNDAKAYALYLSIVEEFRSVHDIDDDPRAIYVGKSLTALGRYVLTGLPSAGVAANAEQAAKYFKEASTFFRDADADFELAKLYLTGEGVEQSNKQAISRLNWLSNEGHAGAQAYFAQLFWRGKLLPRNDVKALALIMRAVENAQARDRVWIEEIYQHIYCGIGVEAQQRLEDQVASFSQKLGPRVGAAPQETYGLSDTPSRSCSDGRQLPTLQRDGRAQSTNTSRTSPVAGRLPPLNQGSVMDIGERGAPDRR